MVTTPQTQPVKEGFTAYYPDLRSELIKNPFRFYAIPLIGFIAKMVMIIPVFFVLVAVAILAGITGLINGFYVIFNGKYWDTAYNYNLKFMRYMLKVTYFMSGLTDKYPGFDFDIQDNFSLEMAKPEKPNKFFAVPIIGGLVRVFLMIPYYIWMNILKNGATIGTMVSSVPVLFSGKYPESTYEFNRDAARVNMATMAYMAGLSDKYPSFSISWNHKIIKIILIIIGILMLFTSSPAPADKSDYYRNPPPQYNQYQ